jgi:hypothetical protein
MKVRVTKDLDHTDKMIIGSSVSASSEDGRLRPATHEECNAYLESVIEIHMAHVRAEWDEKSRELVASLKW